MNKAFKILGWTVVCVLFVFAFTYVTMILWNWVIPAALNAKEITFWQAMALLVLSKILFSGFGGRRWGGYRTHWKRRYNQKLAHMSPEERERFKARMYEKWCHTDKGISTEKQGTSNV